MCGVTPSVLYQIQLMVLQKLHLTLRQINADCLRILNVIKVSDIVDHCLF